MWVAKMATKKIDKKVHTIALWSMWPSMTLSSFEAFVMNLKQCGLAID